MGKLLPRILDTRYESILARERSLAKDVASAVVGTKPVTVWEVMIPVLFLLSLFQGKRTKETFALNFLFTKKLALEGALAEVDKGKSREAVREGIRESTGKILAADRAGLYSSKIRQKQLREIDLLLDHYCRLLQAEGRDYPSLVRSAYPRREDYAAFLRDLERAERDVYQAAQQTVKGPSAREISSRMEEATERARRAFLEKIYS